MEADLPKANLYVRILRRAGHYRWFARATKHVFCKLDRILYRTSKGRLWVSGARMPTMLVTTTGRKTGKPRTVPVYYVRHGDNLVAACEDLGMDQASGWPRNLLADPWAQVQIGKGVRQYRARLATEDEIAGNMPLLVQLWPAHDTYAERSGQRYVFVFEPHIPPSS